MEKQRTFNEWVKFRLKLKLKPLTSLICQYMQHHVLSKTDPQRCPAKPTLPSPLSHALNSFSMTELMTFYQHTVKYLTQIQQQHVKSSEECLQSWGFIRNSLRIWKKRAIRVSGGSVWISKDGQLEEVLLANYLPRISKKSDKHAICLMNYFSDDKKVYLGFNQHDNCSTFYKLIYTNCLERWLIYLTTDHLQPKQRAATVMLASTAHKIKNIFKKREKDQEIKDLKQFASSKIKFAKQKQQFNFIQDIVPVKPSKPQKPFRTDYASKQPQQRAMSRTEKILFQVNDDLAQEQQPKQFNILNRILPNFSLSSLHDQSMFKAIQITPNYRILKHVEQPGTFRLALTLPAPTTAVFELLSSPGLLPMFNPAVQSAQIKNFISTQNSAICHLRMKPYGVMYRARDFVILRHVCRVGEGCVIVDRHAQSAQVPPFVTIVRGVIYKAVYKLEQNGQNCTLLSQLQMSHCGMITYQQDDGMTLTFLKGFTNIQLMSKQRIHAPPVFDLQFASAPQQSQGIAVDRFKPFSQMVQQQGILAQQIKQEFIKPKVILEKGFQIRYGFIKRKVDRSSGPAKQLRKWPVVNGHAIWQGDWQRAEPAGSMVFVNKQKLQSQAKVLRFVVQKIGKNIISGKSILNICLPVDIFSPMSNLQLLARSYGYGPMLLESAAKHTSTLQQLKLVASFMLSATVLYIDIEKPFNPILGQTFQGELAGCPIDLQQISHHPPIAALHLRGRGYTLTGCLQSKVKINLNSGVGSNDGQLSFRFDNGQILKGVFGGGELSGLVTGQRKLNMVGKIVVYCQSAGLFVQIHFNPFNKSYFSYGTAQRPLDAIEGDILKVDPAFFKDYKPKRQPPAKEDIKAKLGKFSGTWCQRIMFEGNVLLDFDKDLPVILDQEPDPLPSNSNYRSDIFYRRTGDILKAQDQKERLQILQREDRKRREAGSK